MIARSEEIFSHVWSHAAYATLKEFVDDRLNNFLLFLSFSSRIECQDGNARIVYEEVALEGVVQNHQSLGNQFFRDGRRNFCYRHFVSSQCYAQVIADKYLECLFPFANSLLYVAGLSSERLVICQLDGAVV